MEVVIAGRKAKGNAKAQATAPNLTVVLLQGEVVIARLTRQMLMAIDSFRRDHRVIEKLLRVLEQECGVFHRAEQPDYEPLGELLHTFNLSWSNVIIQKKTWWLIWSGCEAVYVTT